MQQNCENQHNWDGNDTKLRYQARHWPSIQLALPLQWLRTQIRSPGARKSRRTTCAPRRWASQPKPSTYRRISCPYLCHHRTWTSSQGLALLCLPLSPNNIRSCGDTDEDSSGSCTSFLSPPVSDLSPFQHRLSSSIRSQTLRYQTLVSSLRYRSRRFDS